MTELSPCCRSYWDQSGLRQKSRCRLFKISIFRPHYAKATNTGELGKKRPEKRTRTRNLVDIHEPESWNLHVCAIDSIPFITYAVIQFCPHWHADTGAFSNTRKPENSPSCYCEAHQRWLGECTDLLHQNEYQRKPSYLGVQSGRRERRPLEWVHR